MAACGLKGTFQEVLGSPRLPRSLERKKKSRVLPGVGGRDPLATDFSMHDTFKRRLHKILGRAVPVTPQHPSAAALWLAAFGNELFDKSAVEMFRGNHRHSSPSAIGEGVHGAKTAVSGQPCLVDLDPKGLNGLRCEVGFLHQPKAVGVLPVPLQSFLVPCSDVCGDQAKLGGVRPAPQCLAPGCV